MKSTVINSYANLKDVKVEKALVQILDGLHALKLLKNL